MKRKTVLTGGTFDLFHYGHMRLLNLIKTKYDDPYLIVSLNTDSFVEQYKHPTVCCTLERQALLEELPVVDAVLLNESREDFADKLRQIRPDVVVVGDDWQDKDYYQQMGISQEEFEDLGIKLEYVPHTRGISTTEIIERIYEEE